MALFAWLYYGIHADKLTLGQYEIDGLYIKLDKKLTFTVDKFILPESKAKPSLDNIDETFDRIEHLFTYFDYIELSQIHFKNNVYKFLFTDNTLYIDSNEYEIAGKIERKGKKLIADVTLFYIKKEKVNIVGTFKYFLNKDRLETEGAFEAYNITGNFAAFKDEDDLSFAVRTDTFTDLKTLTAKLPVKEVIKPWIAERLRAKVYKLDSFVGKAKIVDNALKVDVPSLRGEATLKSVEIDYKDGLDPVKASEIKLSYRDRGLYFELKDPSYKKRDLSGSKVKITNMKKGEIALLTLDLQVKSQVDEVVHKILRAYKLNIPVKQKGENVIADIHLEVPLKKKYKSAKEKAKHKVKARIGLQLAPGVVTINKSIKLPVHSGKLRYENGKVTLKDIYVKESWYKGFVNGVVYLKSKKADLKVKIEDLSIGDSKNKYFILKKKNLTLKFDYGKHRAEIPEMKAKMQRKDKKFTIILSDLKRIKPYLKNMAIDVDGGHLDITSSDFLKYTYVGMLKRNSCFFYDKNSVCHTQIPCKGTVSKNGLTLIAFNERLKIDVSKSTINVNHLNVDLKELFKAGEKQRSASKNTKGKTLRIFGKKSKLRYEEYTLVTDHYTIKVQPNGNMYAVGKLGKDRVTVRKKGKNIKVEARRVQDRLLHPLINFKGLHKGRYSFKMSGNPDKVMHGEVMIEGGVMRDFKAYNNTLAFINTLPALATLQNPGYSKQGFHIKKGIAKYRKIGQKIIFDSIHIEGNSASFVGKGVIDLKKNTINMTLAIQTAREFGKVVGNIPLLGYILMGEDKSMTVGLKISGSLSKPVVKTSATKEILKLPLDLIKRTLQSPAHILNKEAKPKKKSVIEKTLLNLKELEFNSIAP